MSASDKSGRRSGRSVGAVAIAFNNDPEILGAMTVLIFLQIVLGAPIGAWMGNKFAGDVEGGEDASFGDRSWPVTPRVRQPLGAEPVSRPRHLVAPRRRLTDLDNRGR